MYGKAITQRDVKLETWLTLIFFLKLNLGVEIITGQPTV
jgi:hypothetical protein